MSKYQTQATLGIIGFGLIVLPMFFKLPAQFTAFDAKSEYENQSVLAQAKTKASEDLERSRIDQRKQTADALHESGVLPSGQKLKITNYLYNSKLDPNPETTGYLASETVYVYDSAGECVGRIWKKKWQFKAWYDERQDICAESPAS